MSADASLVPAQDAEPDEPGEDTPLLQQLAAGIAEFVVLGDQAERPQEGSTREGGLQPRLELRG